jgi:hypothetical protein
MSLSGLPKVNDDDKKIAVSGKHFQTHLINYVYWFRFEPR